MRTIYAVLSLFLFLTCPQALATYNLELADPVPSTKVINCSDITTFESKSILARDRCKSIIYENFESKDELCFYRDWKRYGKPIWVGEGDPDSKAMFVYIENYSCYGSEPKLTVPTQIGTIKTRAYCPDGFLGPFTNNEGPFNTYCYDKKQVCAAPYQWDNTLNDCVTYCPEANPLDELLGRCISKKNNKPNQCEFKGNPINIRSGSKVQVANSLFNLPGAFPLNLKLNYDSQALPEIEQNINRAVYQHQKANELSTKKWVLYRQPSGYKGLSFKSFKIAPIAQNPNAGHLQWKTEYDLTLLQRPDNENIIIKHGIALKVEFFLAWNGKYIPIHRGGERLYKGDTHWKFITEDNLHYFFNLNGQLEKVQHPSGEYHLLAYNNDKLSEITHSSNGTLTLSYFPNTELLATVQLPDGRTYQYEYDDLHNLTHIVQPNLTVKTYHYENPFFPYALTGITDEKGVRYASWTYDNQGRAISSSHANGKEHHAITYSGDKVTTTNPLGKTSTLTYVNGYPREIEGASCDSQGIDSKNTYFYSSYNGELDKKIDTNGLETRFTYYGNGFIRHKIHYKAGEVSKTIFHRYDFEKSTLPTEIHYPNYLYKKASYNELSQPLSTSLEYRGAIRKTTFDYSNNLLSHIDGPRTDLLDTTAITYNQDNQINSVQNALGHTINNTHYDAAGRLIKQLDANGVATEFTYNAMGRLQSVMVGARTTRFSYDNIGQITKVESPDKTLFYEYNDARWLTQIKDQNDNAIHYTHDNAGNVISQNIQGSMAESYFQQHTTFDKVGRPSKSTNGAQNTTTFEYDVAGNITKTIDANLNPQTQTFDLLGRNLTQLNQLNEQITYTYNNQDLISSVTDALGRKTEFKYNGFGEVIERISPDTGITTYDYDEAGNVIWQQDARGIKTSYTYDALNRVTHITTPNNEENIVFEYDDPTVGRFAIGRLSKVTDSSGVHEYHYNQYGEVTEHHFTAHGSVKTRTLYQYNLAGKLAELTYPSGRQVNYHYNTVGSVSSVTTTANGDTQTLASNINYLPFGPLANLDYGNGLSLQMTFDKAYKLTSKTITGVMDTHYQYDALSNISVIENKHAPTQSQTYEYDLVSRLIDAKGQYGHFAYSYDGIGNRLSKTVDTVAVPYNYENGILTHVNGVTRSYDAAGNTLSDGKGTYQYNQTGRLTRATVASHQFNYTYNYQGQRVKKATPTSTRHYHYDLAGLLIAETAATGETLVEYIYLNGQRIAFVADELYYVHTNHIDSPLALTNQQGVTVWQARYTPFGSADITLNSLPEALTARFPGQYADTETGLYYNYFRDYDPELGRYIQSDRLGLFDGPNTYGYAHQNPIMKTDPTGQFVPQFVGGLAGFAFGTVSALLQGQEGWCAIRAGLYSGAAGFVSGGGSVFAAVVASSALSVAEQAGRAGFENVSFTEAALNGATAGVGGKLGSIYAQWKVPPVLYTPLRSKWNPKYWLQKWGLAKPLPPVDLAARDRAVMAGFTGGVLEHTGNTVRPSYSNGDCGC